MLSIDMEDAETQKQEAIKLCKRRIEAAVTLFGDGRIDKDEYRRRIENNERDMAHWESRTTETEKAALELAMCMDAIEKLTLLWDIGEDEDRQGMARSLFSYIVYNLDTRRIVDFRLKPWADRFLVLRSALYEDDLNSENDATITIKPEAEDVIPEGFEVISGASPKMAAQRLLRFLYPIPFPTDPQKKDQFIRESRDQDLHERYAAGERVVDLAEEYEMTTQGIYRVLRQKR